MNKAKSTAIIIGASGGLGSALCQQWQQDNEIDTVFAISRKPVAELKKNCVSDIHFLQCDYNESSIASTCDEIKTLMSTLNLTSVTRACICNGILHNKNIMPEKRLEDGRKIKKFLKNNIVKKTKISLIIFLVAFIF